MIKGPCLDASIEGVREAGPKRPAPRPFRPLFFPSTGLPVGGFSSYKSVCPSRWLGLTTKGAVVAEVRDGVRVKGAVEGGGRVGEGLRGLVAVTVGATTWLSSCAAVTSTTAVCRRVPVSVAATFLALSSCAAATSGSPRAVPQTTPACRATGGLRDGLTSGREGRTGGTGFRPSVLGVRIATYISTPSRADWSGTRTTAKASVGGSTGRVGLFGPPLRSNAVSGPTSTAGPRQTSSWVVVASPGAGYGAPRRAGSPGSNVRPVALKRLQTKVSRTDKGAVIGKKCFLAK